jgi:hypothetical protein
MPWRRNRAGACLKATLSWWRRSKFSASSRLRDLNKLATKIATVRRAEDITVHDATILSHTANPALDGIFRKDK